jgi:hypothetical protein
MWLGSGRWSGHRYLGMIVCYSLWTDFMQVVSAWPYLDSNSLRMARLYCNNVTAHRSWLPAVAPSIRRANRSAPCAVQTAQTGVVEPKQRSPIITRQMSQQLFLGSHAVSTIEFPRTLPLFPVQPIGVFLPGTYSLLTAQGSITCGCMASPHLLPSAHLFRLRFDWHLLHRHDQDSPPV